MFEVQILVCALSCPHRRSLHTRLMVRQLSQEQSTTGSNLVCEQQLFQLARHTWCRSEVSVFDESFATSGTSFKRVINGFKSRLHCQVQHRSARLLVWATVCKTAAIALLVQFQPDLPNLWRVNRSGGCFAVALRAKRRCLLNRWMNNCGSTPLLSACGKLVKLVLTCR